MRTKPSAAEVPKNVRISNRLIADCKKGRIDRVITKSVSRFARNTVDCLETVRAACPVWGKRPV